MGKETKLDAVEIEFRATIGQRFSKYTILDQNGVDDMKDELRIRDAERLVGESLRWFAFLGFIKPVDKEKSKSGKRPARGRPAIVYECVREGMTFSMTEGYKCGKCNGFIPCKKQTVKYCLHCGAKMEG